MNRFSALVAAFAISSAYLLSTAAQSMQAAPLDQGSITDPAEYKAYLEAMATLNPYPTEAFALHYPHSRVLAKVLEHLLPRYLEGPQPISCCSSGDAKVLELTRRLQQIEPDDLRPLAVITAIQHAAVINGIHKALDETCNSARSGLERLAGWDIPDEVKAVEFENVHKQMEYIFNSATGFCLLQQKDFAHATPLLQIAVRLQPESTHDLYLLTIANLEIEPIDPNGLWYCGRTLELMKRHKSYEGAVQAVQKYCEGKYRAYRGTEEGWKQIVEQTAAENTLPSDFTQQLKAARHQ